MVILAKTLEEAHSRMIEGGIWFSYLYSGHTAYLGALPLIKALSRKAEGEEIVLSELPSDDLAHDPGTHRLHPEDMHVRVATKTNNSPLCLPAIRKAAETGEGSVVEEGLVRIIHTFRKKEVGGLEYIEEYVGRVVAG